MRIVDFEIIRLIGPQFSHPVRPAWAPGSTWTNRSATLVKLVVAVSGWSRDP